MGGLFGGGGGGSSGGTEKTVTSTTQELAPEQRELLGLVLPEAKAFAANPPELFPGSAIQGFDPLQIAGQNQALQASQGLLQQLTNQAAGASQFLLDPANLGPSTFEPGTFDPREFNRELEAAIAAATRPIQQQFTQSVLPNIRGGANLAGQVGSSRQGVAEGIASQAFLQQVGDTSATVANDAFADQLNVFSNQLNAFTTQQGNELNAFTQQRGDALNALTQGLSLSPALGQASLLPAQITGAVGQQRQQLDQARLTEEAQKFVSQQIIPFSVAQDIAALAFGIGGGTGETTSTGPAPRGPDPLSQVLGLASLGLGIAGLFP